MKRPSIKLALIGIFAIIAVLFGATAYSALSGIGILNASTTNFSGNVLPSVKVAKDIQIARLQLRGAYEDHVLAKTPEQMKAAVVAIAMKESDLSSAIKNYGPLVSSDYEGAAYKSLLPLVDEYKKQGHALLQLSSAGKKDEASAAFVDILGPLEKKISAQADVLVKLNVDEGNDASADAAVAYSSTLLTVYIVLGTSAVIIIASAYFGMAGIAKPVQVITRSMTGLASGDTDKTIPYAGRADEIGAMANAVEVFRQAAIDNKRLEAEAESNRIKTEADRQRLTAEAEAAAQRRLQEATSGLASGLKRLASGDLSFELTEPFAPDFEALRHDLNGAVAQLGETLRSVAQATNGIDSGSREISQSADDLSRRTEQQAASLEETAAALDQITVNVTNSSRRVDEARTIAIQANSSAAQSGTVVANAVDAIERIEASSTQISNIIGVIDEIAFQTNLLALNAGVEAARAGEAGRGFAVVAQEVRELAQRSAKAAKEIKGLISNSTSEVESGVKLVRATGDSLKTIEQYIVTINQHMDAIATSAREQSTGLGEVNTAVNQMDQVTQQNAAMVEETNAAGATLAGEAGRLRELIAQFNLGGAARAAAPRASGSAAAVSMSAPRPAAAPRAVSRPAPANAVSAVQSPRAHRPVASPARQMVADIAKSYGTAAPSQDNWEEF